MSLEPLDDTNAGAALAYLSHSPYDNVYVAWLIATGQAGHRNDVALSRNISGKVDGVCYLGPQIVPCADRLDAIDEFARNVEQLARHPRSIVGPRPCVERFWRSAKRALRRPRAIRTSQPVYVLERARLRGSRIDAGVDRATPAEVEELAVHSAMMTAGELGMERVALPESVRARTARLVRDGWWWRYRVNGQLAFQCNVGSATPQTAQLQGVWVPPHMRHQGYATRALGAICDRLLDEFASLSLYVNDFNASAIMLYERVGFMRAGEFATIIF